MKLTRNDKKILKLLLENSRISDRKIASKLKISSQAVGKIRKKLEETVIDSYTLKIDCSKFGINIYALTRIKLSREGLEKGGPEIEKILYDNPHTIHIYRIAGYSSHVILYGFKDMNELDYFFHSPEMKEELHKFIETQEFFTFSHKGMVKNNPVKLFHKAIDDMGSRISRMNLENFKEK